MTRHSTVHTPTRLVRGIAFPVGHTSNCGATWYMSSGVGLDRDLYCAYTLSLSPNVFDASTFPSCAKIYLSFKSNLPF